MTASWRRPGILNTSLSRPKVALPDLLCFHQFPNPKLVASQLPALLGHTNKLFHIGSFSSMFDKVVVLTVLQPQKNPTSSRHHMLQVTSCCSCSPDTAIPHHCKGQTWSFCLDHGIFEEHHAWKYQVSYDNTVARHAKWSCAGNLEGLLN